MSKAARVQEPLVPESVSEGKVCPLFAQHDPPIYADHVAEIRLYRSNKKDERFELAAEDFYIDGDPEDLFLIDPYETTAQELQLQFGGGIYWIEAYRKPDGLIWKGSGRRLILAGPVKATDPGAARSKAEDEHEEQDDEEEDENEPETGFARHPSSANSSFVDAIREEANQRARFAQEEADKRAKMAEDNARRLADMAREDRDKTVDMHQMFTTAMLNAGKSNSDPSAAEERIRILRDENESLRNRHTREQDDLRQKNREDLAKRDSQHEEAMRAERRRTDAQIDEMRSRHRTQEDELRRRWTEDVQDLKSRYEQQLSQLREERSAERMKFQNEQERDRTKYEEQIRVLQRENIELEKKTNAAEAALEALQNAPSGGPGLMDYVVRLAATPLGEKLFAGALARAQAAAVAAANADPNAAASQQVPMAQGAEQAAFVPNPAPSPAPEQAAQQGPVFIPTPQAPTPWAPMPQQATPPPNNASPGSVATSAPRVDAPANGVAHVPAPEAAAAAQESAA